MTIDNVNNIPGRGVALYAQNADGSFSPVPMAGLVSGRIETLWTDDTGAFFVRVDNGTTIAWTDVSGTTASAPGTGARPASGESLSTDIAHYQAIATATGYTSGDIIDHYLTFDPGSGAVIGSFWYNTTTSAKITAPTAGNISRIVGKVQMLGDDGAVLVGSAGDTAWNGAAASPTWTQLWKYIATKIEAIRAALVGTLTVQQPQARSATYAVDGNGYTAYSTPQDMIGIRGSATKTIIVTNFSIRVNSTAATLASVYCIKRSSANTGGTLTNPSGVPYDSGDAAATAIVDVYTALPTMGSAAGILRIVNAVTTVLTSLGAAFQLIAGNQYGAASAITLQKPITLRGVNEALYMNFQGAALPGGFTAAYSIEWIEY